MRRRLIPAAAVALTAAGATVGVLLWVGRGEAPLTPPPIIPARGSPQTNAAVIPEGLLWSESRTASPLHQDGLRWIRTDRRDLPPLLDPCGDAPADVGTAIAVRQVALIGPELWKAERLLLYADAAAATRAFGAQREALARCSGRQRADAATTWVTAPVAAGDEALFVTGQRYRDGRGVPGNHRGVLMRAGRAVVMYVDFGPRTRPAAPADVSSHVDHARIVAERIITRLPP